MSTTRCMMQFHAHPDDEASKGAGVAAKCAAEGGRSVLITFTGGEAGEILNPAADTPEARSDLAAVRRRELDESVKILGYDSLHFLGYRDSGMPDSEENARLDNLWNTDFDQVLERVVAIVRAEKPQVFLAYDEDHSFYPHPDHIRAQEIAVAAFDAAADASRFPQAGEPWQPLKLYHVGWTHRRISTFHDAVVARGGESWFGDRLKDWDPAGDKRFMTQIDVSKYLTHRSNALRAHATQVAPDSFWFALPDEVIAEIYPYEDYVLGRSLVEVERNSEGFETDMFSGIPL